MFEYLKKFNRVFVTGPQRSGTTIAARMIAADTGHRLFDEDAYGNAGKRFWNLARSADRSVIHCPAFSHWMERPEIAQEDGNAIVWMDRDVEGILRSRHRVGWIKADIRNFQRWRYSHATDIVHRQRDWQHRISKIVKHPYTVSYSSLADHPLWVPPSKRKRFALKQTSEWTVFPESKIAHRLLDELQGIEIGASAHNPFHLSGCINVDIQRHTELTFFGKHQLGLCGRIAQVHLVSDMGSLPFKDRELDYVLASHVLEHAFDPLSVLAEWIRVAKRYVVLFIPHAKRFLPDRDKPLTTVGELEERRGKQDPEGRGDRHWSRWTCESFKELLARERTELSEFHPYGDKLATATEPAIDFVAVVDAEASRRRQQ